MTREMFRSSHYNYLIIGHLHDPTICRLPLGLASECVSSDIKIVCLRPQTTDSQPNENIFSANAKKNGEIRKMVQYNRREKVLILSFTLFQSLEFPSKFQISQQPNIQI